MMRCPLVSTLTLLVLVALALSGCSRQSEVERVEWPVMSTVAAVQFRGKPLEADKEVTCRIQTAIGRVDDEFNVYDPQSTICRTGSCSAFGKPCWDFAFKLKARTDGAFDPGWRGAGKLDFGAVAKGFAVDMAAEAVLRDVTNLTSDVLIDLGGNLKSIKGDWTVGIKDGESFVLKEGEACATSARYYRGSHIKDGRTGADVTNAIHSVTVVHPSSALVADGLSTVLFILGREKGESFLREHHPEARAIWIADRSRPE